MTGNQNDPSSRCASSRRAFDRLSAARLASALAHVAPAFALWLAALLPLTPAQAQTARLVTYQDFATRIVGQPMKTKIGGFGVTATFRPDGTLKVRALLGQATGTWFFNEQQKICLSVTAVGQVAEGCHHLFDLGDGKTFQGDGGRQWVMQK